ncbi:MAG: TonB-dependent receptor [Saprospirales bacterium]|nr:MAG: TonB-dependent receptor [Saprospirales bacterium]
MNRFYWLLIYLFFFSSLGLSAQNQLTVTVLDSEGNPLSGAEVLLNQRDLSATTANDGQFTFFNLESGAEVILVSYGFSFARKSVLIEGDTEVSLVVKSRVELDEIQVLSSRVGDAGPLSFTNLSADEISRRNYGQDVPYLLKQTPSVTVTSDAGTGIGYTGIRIRGVDPTRINVQMNGIPVNDSESQGVFWVNMPDLLSSVNDIQVQRGVGTSAMGGNSFGGIININTNRVTADPFMELNGSYGSFNTRRAMLRFGTGLTESGFFAEGRVSRIFSDGYIDRATADLRSVFFAAGYVGDRSSLRVNLIHGEEITYQAWYGVPAELLGDRDTRTFNPAGMDRPDRPHPNEVDDYRQTHLQLFYNYTHNHRWESGLTLHYTRGLGFFEQYRANQRYSSYGIEPVSIGGETVDRTDLIRRRWLDNDFYGLIINSNYQLSGETALIFGAGWNHYIGDHFGEVIWARTAPSIENDFRYYENDADKYDFNFFGKMEHRMGDFLAWLDLQYRNVEYRFLGFDSRLENVDQTQTYNFFNPKAGLTWMVNETTNIYSSIGISHREPNRRDFTESSPESRPEAERMSNLELGLRTSGENWNLNTNFYYMGYSDQLVITGRINDVGAQVRENVDNSFRAGIEVGASYRPFSSLEVFANATFSRNRIKDYEFFVDKYGEDWSFDGQDRLFFSSTPIALSPEQIISGGFNLDLFTLRGSATEVNVDTDLFSSYVSRQYLDNTGNRDNSIDPYYYADMNFNIRINRSNWPELRLNFMIRNLTDQLYETDGWSYSYFLGDQKLIDQGFFPQAGRNFLAGLTVSF